MFYFLHQNDFSDEKQKSSQFQTTPNACLFLLFKSVFKKF
jgi:hypothetical protein